MTFNDFLWLKWLLISGSEDGVRVSDGSSDVSGQDGQRHLHRAASDNANTEANPNNGIGKTLESRV